MPAVKTHCCSKAGTVQCTVQCVKLRTIQGSQAVEALTSGQLFKAPIVLLDGVYFAKGGLHKEHDADALAPLNAGPHVCR
jgi:hypothetical protein